jgi:hypothetical protein
MNVVEKETLYIATYTVQMKIQLMNFMKSCAMRMF